MTAQFKKTLSRLASIDQSARISVILHQKIPHQKSF